MGDTEPGAHLRRHGRSRVDGAAQLPEAAVGTGGQSYLLPVLRHPATTTSPTRASCAQVTASTSAATATSRWPAQAVSKWKLAGTSGCPSNAKGITSNRVYIYDTDGVPNNQTLPPPAPWKGDQQSADIAISTGFNQAPDYSKFEQLYLDPTLAAAMEDYLKADAGDGRELPVYLFDRPLSARRTGHDGLFVSPDLAKGFVNYVRGLQGLKSLETDVEQRDYLAQAWDYWLALPTAQATPFDAFIPRMTKGEGGEAERSSAVLSARASRGSGELRASSAGARNARDSGTTARLSRHGVELLADAHGGPEVADVPEARSSASCARRAAKRTIRTAIAPTRRSVATTPSKRCSPVHRSVRMRHWRMANPAGRGDFETYAGRVISNGGGKVEFVSPGGAFKLANSAALPGETGQPTGPFDRGNALRAGVVTVDGGEINVFAHDSVTLNESRILTTKGGNVMVWSSYGDIAAGKGAKTSISPKFYDYSLDPVVNMGREPAGLPTGAGIGTVASQPGSPEADVDLVAPNGIVDAGDAGIRVSGNFNVFAVQILGTDNIDVQGVSTGLPVPPAAPPTSLNVDDAAAKGSRVIGALLESLKSREGERRHQAAVDHRSEGARLRRGLRGGSRGLQEVRRREGTDAGEPACKHETH